MSYCEIITFKNGVPDDRKEFRNAWGGAARIWTALYDLYLKDRTDEYSNWLSDTSGRLWKLVDDARLTDVAKAVLTSTFDRAIVAREHFKRFAADLEAFDEAFPAPENHVSHLWSWVKFVSDLGDDVEAVGFYGTSCGEDLFTSYDEETDEYIPYNLNEQQKHFEVYAWLEEKKKDAKDPDSLPA